MELNKQKCEIIKKKDIELIKMIKEKEHYENRIYYLQKKLFLPITYPIPKDEKSNEKENYLCYNLSKIMKDMPL